MRWGLRYCLLYYNNPDIDKITKAEEHCHIIYNTIDDPKVEARAILEFGAIKNYIDTQITTQKDSCPKKGLQVKIFDNCLDMYESKVYKE